MSLCELTRLRRCCCEGEELESLDYYNGPADLARRRMANEQSRFSSLPHRARLNPELEKLNVRRPLP